MTMHPNVSVLLALAVAIGASAHGSMAAQPADPLWSDKPHKVEKQDPPLERVPAKPAEQLAIKIDGYPLKLDRTIPYRVLDSVSFVQDGKKYRLADLDPVATGKTCTSAEGQRWACGLRSRVALNQLLKGSKPVRCAPRGERDGFTLVECLRGDKDIGEALASAGFALAANGKDKYRDEQDNARTKKSGVWADGTAAAQ